MTLTEFYDELSKLTGSRRTAVRKWLKSSEGITCPIVAVARNKYNKNISLRDAIQKTGRQVLGLSKRTQDAIVAAADGKIGYRETVRKKMRKAVGLPESDY